jgi:hypothetical protein
MKTTTRAADRWWVLQQHDQFSVVQGDKAPSLSVQPGERKKMTYGPYATKQEADAKADEIFARTIRGQSGEAR